MITVKPEFTYATRLGKPPKASSISTSAIYDYHAHDMCFQSP